mgnify:CR=1 FL=1
MKLGTQILLPDGQEATVIYSSLVGVGVKFGLHDPKPEDFSATSGGFRDDEPPEDWEWFPDALLRDPWPGCESAGFKAEQCIGEGFEVIREGLGNV